MERTNTNLVAVKNIWLKLLFQSWFSVHLVLHRLYRWIISLTKYMIASLLSLMFFINLNFIYNVYPAWIFSVHCVKEVDWKSTLKSEFQSYVFDDVRKTVSLRPLHCDVDVLTVTDENHKRYIFPILPFNVPRSYTLLCWFFYHSIQKHKNTHKTIDCLMFCVPVKIVHSYKDVTIAG